MSLQSRKAFALASVLAIAATGAAASSAQANFQKTLTYTCVYPYVGAQPLTVAIDANLPASYAAEELTPELSIKAVATAGGNTSSAVGILGATSLEGTASAKATVDAAGGQRLPLTLPIAVPKQQVKSTGDLVLSAAGSTPEIQFSNPGMAKITVDAISLTLIARNASGNPVVLDPSRTTVPQTDSDPNTFQVSCSLSPATQSTLLANISVFDSANPTTDSAAPSTPGKPTAANVKGTSAYLTWSDSTDDVGVSSYEISYGGKTTMSASPSATLTGLKAKTSYTVTVKAKDGAGNTSGASSSTSFTTAAADDAVGNTIVDYNYNAAGTASLKTLVTGSLPLAGTIDAKITLPSGNFVGELALAQAKGKLTALGFLPVDALVDIIPQEKVAGTLVDGKLTAVAKVRIKLPSVKTLGIQLAGGANCQTKSISAITLKSTQPFFYPLEGGPIAGTFAISDLTGCGFLTGIVSPLTAGSGNLIALNLSNRK
ncbi:MAG: fibronectin type III domain-containing protein [Solirubrobacteraceae bacterium]|nr:fibronectin type III domain-containing protein [Solirubrobacteraceae bacterium]